MSFKCRSCGSVKIVDILDLSDQPWGNDFINIKENRISDKYPLNFVICSECMMSQINYTVPKEKMFVDHSYMSGTTRTLSKHFSKISENILNKIDLKNDEYVLDIGGNDGTFLRNFLEKKIKVLNVDSGKQQAEISKKNGVECINDFFNEKLASSIKKKHGSASVIHGSGIFFHLEELNSVFKGVKNLLKSDGIIVAEFINLMPMMKNLAFDQIYHEHLLYYSINTLQGLLKKYDLEIIDAEKFDIHGGSCVAYIQHVESNSPKSDRLIEYIKEEVEFGIYDLKTYKEFAINTINLKKELLELLKKLKKDGKKVFGLGAPVKGSTIINFLNIDETLLECAVEINPYKFNTYYPGTRIPVVDQNSVSDPDYYFMLSWNFKDEIISKMQDFKKKGGKFIVPSPSVQII